MTKQTPRVRRDGHCYMCRKPRKMPNPPQKGVDVSAYLLDPFCSAECSRKYWGTSLKKAPTAAQMKGENDEHAQAAGRHPAGEG